MNKSVIGIVLAAVGGAAVGSAATYFIAGRVIRDKWLKYADDEIQEVKLYYRKLNKEGEFSSPESTVEVLYGAEAISELEDVEDGSYEKLIRFTGYSPKEDDEQTEWNDTYEKEQERFNVSDLSVDIDEDTGLPVVEAPEETSKEPEIDEFYLNRDHRVPFVISEEEFNTEEEDFDKINLSWYEGDDTLCDDRERVVQDVESTVGYANLERFGDHSNNKNTVYIRNVDYASDFEVFRHKGEYVNLVLGMPSEKEKKRKPGKMRGDDE